MKQPVSPKQKEIKEMLKIAGSSVKKNEYFNDS